MRPAVPELAALMAAQGITGKDLATRAGIALPTFSSILHRRHDPSIETAKALAKVLGVPVKKLGVEISKRHLPPHLCRAPSARKSEVQHE